jgi:hypothetical protein
MGVSPSGDAHFKESIDEQKNGSSLLPSEDGVEIQRTYNQNDIQGKNVEIAELMGEQNETNLRFDRTVEDGGRIVPVEEEGRIEKDRGRREKRDGQLRDDHLRDIISGS